MLSEALSAIDISYTLDSASQDTKLKPKISAVSPMKIGGGHIGRSHSGRLYGSLVEIDFNEFHKITCE